MTRNQILALARQAELPKKFGEDDQWVISTEQMVRFAHLIIVSELDACCVLLEGMHYREKPAHNIYLHAAAELRRLRANTQYGK